MNVAILDWQARHHHVGVPDCLNLTSRWMDGDDGDLVDVEILYDGVEDGVEVIEQVNNLHRGACRRYRGEADNIAEQKVDN